MPDNVTNDEQETTPVLKYVTISINESLRDDLQFTAHKYATKIGMRRLSMNDLVLIMLKNFREVEQL